MYNTRRIQLKVLHTLLKLISTLFLTGFIIFTAVTAAKAQSITGAGSTFAAPIYTKWSDSYNKETKVQINYNSIGSGGGMKQIEVKTVDFGATDDPVSDADIIKMGYYQFPTVIGGVVPVINLPGVTAGQMVLDGITLADIFQGKISKWNDAAIQKLNPKLTLPASDITIVTRADGSGTTAVFTDYLSMVSKDFKQAVGSGKVVHWLPVNAIAGKGNSGVAAFIQKLPNTIGYVEYAYVKQSKMTFTAMKNRKGQIVLPDDLTFAEAAKSANWSTPNMSVNLNNQDGWPITSTTFVVVYKTGGANTKEVIKFFDYAFSKGNATATELDYVPLTDKVKSKIKDDWKKLGLF